MPCACRYAYIQPCRRSPCKESVTTSVFNRVLLEQARFEYGNRQRISLLRCKGKFNVRYELRALDKPDQLIRARHID